MKNKRGLLLIITLILILVIFIALGILYFQLRTQGLKFSTGNIVIKIDYNNSEENTEKNTVDSNISIKEEEINKTNNTIIFFEENLSYENLSDYNNT